MRASQPVHGLRPDDTRADVDALPSALPLPLPLPESLPSSSRESASEANRPGPASMRRIVILGCAGSGKSTLARLLGERLALPVFHLDQMFWQPGWVKPSDELFDRRVREAVVGESWVIEGNYDRRSFKWRLPRADTLIWMDMPRMTCLRRVLGRTWRGVHRLSSAAEIRAFVAAQPVP